MRYTKIKKLKLLDITNATEYDPGDVMATFESETFLSDVIEKLNKLEGFEKFGSGEVHVCPECGDWESLAPNNWAGDVDCTDCGIGLYYKRSKEEEEIYAKLHKKWEENNG